MVNSVARVELLPELQLTGTLAKPALDGQVAVADDGRIQVSGRQDRVRDSRIEFRPERGMMPRLDVTGNTRVGDYTVYLRLTGPANEIETSLMSDPPLGERDLQTLLVTGQRENLGGGGASDQAAVGVASGDVLGAAGQFLGFDSVVVGTTDDLALVSSDVDPALRLTVSKRLGNRFELVLSDNLDDNELTWVDHLSAPARLRVPGHLPRGQRVHRRVPPGGSVRARGVAPAHRVPAPGRTGADPERYRERRAGPARCRGAVSRQPEGGR